MSSLYLKPSEMTGNQWRDQLLSQGYTDWDWANGWSGEVDKERRKIIESSSPIWKHQQHNRSGSDCTFWNEQLKIFYAVDMGD